MRIERNKKGANLPIPDWYKEKQEVPQELGWFWIAFWDLDTCRSYIESAPCRIPWTVVLQYARQYEVNFDYLWTVISIMDKDYVTHKVKEHNAKIEEMSKKNKAAANKKTGRRHGR